MDKNGRTNLFLGWAAVLMLAASVLFTACPNATKTPESPTPMPEYTPVAYDKLAEYLENTASKTDVNYIEVTGLEAEYLKGVESERNPKPSPLGAILQDHSIKKVALKLGGSVSALMDMPFCFYGCTSLVGVAAIPKGVKDMEMSSCFTSCTNLMQAPAIPEGVKNMTGCFRKCTSLAKAPASIPASVKDMSQCFQKCTSLTQGPAISEGVEDMKACFWGCTSLTEVPAIPASVTEMSGCFLDCEVLTSVTLKCNYGDGKFVSAFKSCIALGEKSIKVPRAYYGNYTTAKALHSMVVPGTTEAEKKAKFEGV